MNKKYLIIPIVIALLLYNAPSTKEKIETLEAKLNTLKPTDVFEHYSINKELMEYKKSRITYEKNYAKYKALYAHEKSCTAKAREENIKFLKLESTYDEQFKNTQWYDQKTFLITFSFKGKNLLGVESTFKKNYTCKLDNDTEKLTEFLEVIK